MIRAITWGLSGLVLTLALCGCDGGGGEQGATDASDTAAPSDVSDTREASDAADTREASDTADTGGDDTLSDGADVDGGDTGSGGIDRSEGEIAMVSRPDTVVPNENESPNLRMFVERADYELPAELGIEAREPGTYDKNNELPGGQIASGTQVDVYYIHADTPDNNSRQRMEATVEFSRPIAGVVATADAMVEANDVLRVSELSTTYPSSGTEGFGIDVVQYSDSFEIGPNRRTLTLDIGVKQTSDSMRVILTE